MRPPESEAHDLETFARSERDELVALAYLIAGTRTEAEDIVQEVLARLTRADLAAISDLTAYARRAIANECVTWGRRTTRRARGMSRLRLEARRLHAGIADPLGRVELASALGRLPARYRGAIVLRYYLDWTDDDIADALDCAPSTVRSWLSRGLAQLREELGDKGIPDDRTAD